MQAEHLEQRSGYLGRSQGGPSQGHKRMHCFSNFSIMLLTSSQYVRVRVWHFCCLFIGKWLLESPKRMVTPLSPALLAEQDLGIPPASVFAEATHPYVSPVIK